jgi:hypothetical protein
MNCGRKDFDCSGSGRQPLAQLKRLKNRYFLVALNLAQRALCAAAIQRTSRLAGSVRITKRKISPTFAALGV